MQKFTDVIQRIELVRKEAAMSPAQFASALRIPVQELAAAIEGQNGPPSVELIRAVILRFGIRPNWLLNGIGPKNLHDAELEDGWGAKVRTLRHEVGDLGEQIQEDHAESYDLEDLISNVRKLRRLLDRLETELCAIRDRS
jgi:transcriptional regulator with XRE-family HTH domain